MLTDRYWFAYSASTRRHPTVRSHLETTQNANGLVGGGGGQHRGAGDARDDLGQIVIYFSGNAPGSPLSCSEIDRKGVVTGTGTFADNVDQDAPSRLLGEEFFANAITRADAT